jgi:hypothetical protein
MLLQVAAAFPARINNVRLTSPQHTHELCSAVAALAGFAPDSMAQQQSAMPDDQKLEPNSKLVS